MLSGASLKKDTIFYGIATLAERIVSLFIVMLLTKTLAQEIYGIWTQIIVTTTVVSHIILAGFNISAVRFLAGEKTDGELSSVFHRMSLIVLVNSLIAVIAAFLFAKQLSGAVFGNLNLPSFVYLLGFYLSCESLFELVMAFLRARKKIKLLSAYYFVKNVARIVVIALVILVLRKDLQSAIILIIILQFLMTLFIYSKDILGKIGFSFSLKNAHWREILSFSMPIIPYNLLISAGFFINRYFILHMINMNQVSIYAVSYSIAAITGLCYTILSYTAYPHMAGLWNNNDKTGAADIFRQSIIYYLFFAVPIIIGLTALSRPIISLLSTSEYLAGRGVVFWLSCGMGIFGLYQLGYNVTLIAGRTVLNLGLAAAALVVNLALNFVFIPKFGISGAAASVFFSNTVLALFTIMIGRKYLSYSFPWFAAGKILFGAAAMLLFLIAMPRYFDMSNLFILIATIACAAVIYGVADLTGRNSILVKLNKNI